MFRIFDRYLGRQVLTTTLFAVVILSVVLVLGQIFKKLLDQLVEGLITPDMVGQFVLLILPPSLGITLPWGILTAVLLTFGRLSADNELVSLRMAGLSLPRICAPVLLFALLLSGLCFWLNTTVGPASTRQARELTRKAVLADPRKLFVPDKPIDSLKKYRIYYESQTGETMHNMAIIALQDDRTNRGNRLRLDEIILAETAQLQDQNLADHNQLNLALGSSIIMDRHYPPAEELTKRTAPLPFDPPDISDITVSSYDIPLDMKGLMASSLSVKTSTLPMAELQHAITHYETYKAQPTLQATKVPTQSEFRTEYHKRISFSLACFVLTLVGIPLGITAQRRETSSGFFISLAVGISYFALITMGDLWQARPSMKPVLWVWLPNVLFGLLGIWLFIKSTRR